MASEQHADASDAKSDLSTQEFHSGLEDDIYNALKGLKSSGSFASFHELPNAPPADLFVNEVGEIQMPLDEPQARQLIAKSRQAPYGKGSETLVDTSVRNTWELDASQFTFRNPTWISYLQNLCTTVARDLGINAPIKAEIYKMLIYERGAMFKAHTDTEKIPGMFGTLIISLPSTHQGGELVLKHGSEKKVFKTCTKTQSFACWYSDVSHQVLTVTAGYRWVLTYNLALDLAQPRPSAGLQRSETRPLRHALRRWLAVDKSSREHKYLYHVFDHDYTEANISLEALKAHDLTRIQVLNQLSKELPIQIFFGLLEKSEMGTCEDDKYSRGNFGRGSRYERRSRYDDYYDEDDDEEFFDDASFHELEEVFETNYNVKTLVDLSGKKVSEGLLFDQDDVLENECFEGLKAEESYEGYMGNSGPTATHWYRRTAVAIVPHDSLASFFYDNNSRDSGRTNFQSQLLHILHQLKPVGARNLWLMH